MILNHHHVVCVEVRGVKEVPIKRTIVNCIINKYEGVCIKIHPSSDPNLLFASLVPHLPYSCHCEENFQTCKILKVRETSSRALQLLSTIRQIEFCIALLVLKNVFGYGIVLCKVNQKKLINLLELVNIAQDITNELK